MRRENFLTKTWWTALERAAEGRRGDGAIQFEGADWSSLLTYGDWLARAAELAAVLVADGVGPGDTVAVLAPGSPAWPVVQVACSRIGAIVVPVNSRYRRDELSHVLGLTRPRVVLHIGKIREDLVYDRLQGAVDPAHAPVFVMLHNAALDAGEASLEGRHSRWTWAEYLARSRDEAPPPPVQGDPRDAVLMQFTSGTTAFPKGALLGSASTLQATYELGLRMGLTSDDVMYSTQPMYHVGGSVATTLMALTIGCLMVVPERYSPSETFRLIPKYGVTARTGQAAMYAMELAHPDFRTGTFRTVTKGWSGGTPELKQAVVERMGIPGLVSTYGLTEASASTTVCDVDDPLATRLSTSGRALPGLEVAILADGAMHTASTPVGEVCVRGWSLMIGYYRDEAATRAAVDAEGWLHTGDLARLDAGGNLHFVDRLKEMIKPGGENVSPLEIERVISTISGVNEVAVVGRPDERLGEVPVAFVERAADSALTAQQVISVCRESMASFKVPSEVIFVSNWPMTESGKILKRALRDDMVAGGGTSWIGQSG